MAPIDELSFEKPPEGDHRRGSHSVRRNPVLGAKVVPDRYIEGEHISLLDLSLFLHCFPKRLLHILIFV